MFTASLLPAICSNRRLSFNTSGTHKIDFHGTKQNYHQAAQGLIYMCLQRVAVILDGTHTQCMSVFEYVFACCGQSLYGQETCFSKLIS